MQILWPSQILNFTNKHFLNISRNLILKSPNVPDGGLDLPGGDGGPLVVVGQFGSLGSDTLEEIVDERVHDAHRLGADAGVGVDLFQDLKEKI